MFPQNREIKKSRTKANPSGFLKITSGSQNLETEGGLQKERKAFCRRRKFVQLASVVECVSASNYTKVMDNFQNIRILPLLKCILYGFYCNTNG